MGFPWRRREGVIGEEVDDDNDGAGKYNLRPLGGSSSSFPHNCWWRLLVVLERLTGCSVVDEFPWGKADEENWRKPPVGHGTLRRVSSTTKPRRSESTAVEPGNNTWQSSVWRGKFLHETLPRDGHRESWQSVNRIKQLVYHGFRRLRGIQTFCDASCPIRLIDVHPADGTNRSVNELNVCEYCKATFLLKNTLFLSLVSCSFLHRTSIMLTTLWGTMLVCECYLII